MTERPPANGLVCTFYSYKGGVGRSMALANVAAMLCKAGKKVLILDWDLEAPGIERFFIGEPSDSRDRRHTIQMRGSRSEKKGVVDLVVAHRDGKNLDWRQECLIEASLYKGSPPISIISAGQDTPDYPETVQHLDWSLLFEEHHLGKWLFELREAWRAEFDFVLIDSRTGISDIGGICTIILPDVLVLLFTTNEQSMKGCAEVMRRARQAQEELPIDRGRLVAVPVLARDESQNEYESAQLWRDRIANEMREFFNDWLLRGIEAREVLERLYIPYVAYWSFGERLPVFERETELQDERKLGAAYAKLAGLIETKLDWSESMESGRETSETPTRTYSNIVLCADGPGGSMTKGGGSNAWKVFQGIDRRDHEDDPSLPRQLPFYDESRVGSPWSLSRILGRAFGYGLQRNILKLYQSLAQNYRPGDRIFLFGFGGGAFEIRSLAGMISEIGIIDSHGVDIEEFEDFVKKAYRAYRQNPRAVPVERFRAFCSTRGVRLHDAEIELIGVWDTVPAYKMPIAELRVLLYDMILNKLGRPHHLGTSDNMRKVYHALAIDEDRAGCAPILFDEAPASEQGVRVQQVWFAGTHTNVGGGDGRQGLSEISLDWMMTKAERQGLRFTESARKTIGGDALGSLRDERSGPGVTQRYRPRDISELCARASTSTKVHVSVLDRISLAVGDYAPLNLPAEFEVVGEDDGSDMRVERFQHQIDEARGLRERESAAASRLVGLRNLVSPMVLLTFFGVIAVALRSTLAPTAKPVGSPMASWLERTLKDPEAGVFRFLAYSYDKVETVALWVAPGGEGGIGNRLVKAVFDFPEGLLVLLLIIGLAGYANRYARRELRNRGLKLWRRALRDDKAASEPPDSSVVAS